jgi:hypothetical protein
MNAVAPTDKRPLAVVPWRWIDPGSQFRLIYGLRVTSPALGPFLA